jgi:MFS transporter, Spinster family, sphingosine-1-phosphate transporter
MQTTNVLLLQNALCLMQLYTCFSVSLIFGIITCAAGVTGVLIGTYSAGFLRKITPKADPLICGVGLIAGAPFLYMAIICSNHSTVATWVILIFQLY